MTRPAPRHEAEPPAMTEAIGQFLSFLAERGASTNTIAAYRRDLDQLSLSIETGRSAGMGEGISREAIEEFVLHLQGQGYREASIARKLAAARSFFVFLTGEGALTVNPTEGLALPKIQKPLPRPVSADQIERLLLQPAGSGREVVRDRAMLELLYATGMRVGELVALDIGDIRLEAENPHIRCRGRRSEERMMFLTPRATKALVEYVDSARPKLAREDDEQALFLNRRGGRLTRQGVWLIVKEYAKSAGLSEEITPHTLRHSFAAQMLESGMPLSNVQQLLGHSALSSTRIYSAFSQNSGA